MAVENTETAEFTEQYTQSSQRNNKNPNSNFKLTSLPLHIDIITLFPQMFEGPFGHSILKRAVEKKLVEIHFHNLRDFTEDKYKSVDDYPYGGGGGMVLMIEPIDRCLNELSKSRKYDEIIYLAPDGEPFNQKSANYYSTKKNLILLCGHYKGVDERVREHLITREISIGDYVLSGGELPAAVFCDAVVRLLPGAISDETSALSDSFQDNLIAPPVYTRPADYRGWKVPDVLLNGHEKNIQEWRNAISAERTNQRRPGLHQSS